MPSRGGTEKPPQTRKQAGKEYRFKIDVFTPETLPMKRLAEYLAPLATMLGEETAVHFQKLEPGSTVVVHKVDFEAIPKVRERAAAIRRGDAPKDAVVAFRAINKLLREDNGVGTLRDRKNGADIIRFPGREEEVEKPLSIRQHGSIDGIVMRVGGRDETVPVLIQTETQEQTGIWTERRIAKELAVRLFESVRVFGKGRWTRDVDGFWKLMDFKIESFEPLLDTPLSAAIGRLRAIPTEWGADAYTELDTIRHGPKGGKHGGH
jgi:hypothetical protein